MRIEPITTPASAPVLLAEVKDHLRVDGPHEDSALSGFIAASVQTLERYADLALIERQVNVFYECRVLPSQIAWWDGVADGALATERARSFSLPLRPVSSIDAITFTPHDGVETPLAASSYRLVPGLDASVHLSKPPAGTGQLKITMTAGFGNSWNHVPADLRQALLLLVTAYYSNRGDGEMGGQGLLRQSGAGALLKPYMRVRI